MKKKGTKRTSAWIGTIDDAVALTGQSRSAIERATKAAALKPTGKAPGKGGAALWRLPEILAALADRPVDARQRKDAAIAEWTELRISRERRQLLPRDQVVREGQRYVAAVQARLRAVTPRLRQEMAVDEAIAAKVEALVEEAIGEMHGWRTELDLLTATGDAV